MIKDFTYGIEAEKERDLGKTMSFFKNVQSTRRPVNVTISNGQSFCMFVNGYHDRGERIYLGSSASYQKENRVIVPVDYIISVEQILMNEVYEACKGQLTIRRGDLESEGYRRSGRDFFQVIRFAHQQGKAIRVYLSDDRIIEGVSTGMNEQSANLRLPKGNRIQVFYDWVNRIIPIEKI